MRQFQQNHWKQNLYATSCFGVLVIFGSLTLSPTANAQHLRLAIGQYACTTNNQCGADEYCDIDSHECKGKPVCETCETCEECAECEVCPPTITCATGQQNINGHCVDCTQNSDCPNEKPVCDTMTNICVGCTAFNTATPYWNGSECTTCPIETPRWNGTACEACPDELPHWNAEMNACVTCICLDSSKPAYDTANKTCKTCADVDISTPVWNNNTGVCEACPLGQIWDSNTQKCKTTGSCSSNAQCDTRTQYCYITGYTTHCIVNTSGLSGTCTDKGSLGSGYNVRMTDGTVTVYHSSDYMNWWSAKYWCEAHGKKLLDIGGTRLGCYWPNTTSRVSFGRGTGNNVNCCSLEGCAWNVRGYGMRDLQSWFGYGSYWGWVITDNDDCNAYRLRFNSGWVDLGYRSNKLFAMCE